MPVLNKHQANVSTFDFGTYVLTATRMYHGDSKLIRGSIELQEEMVQGVGDAKVASEIL
ncbi:unnamed protein product [Clavelina lepadiformis]|uniref:Uncharacterized protein n=1 Tax=Clavelina lepadiformis TaxID=159417 RepID=A0ABP0FZR7_CLALP